MKISIACDHGAFDMKEAVKAHADTQGESLNAFINRAITETMERDTAATADGNG